MKILLDASPAKILEYRKRYSEDFGQFRTPGTNYALCEEEHIAWAADNFFFTNPDVDAWLRWIARFDENRARRPLFVALPDIPFHARRTLELFEHFKLCTNELPRALVIQNGIEDVNIPWRDVAAVFIGGDDAFKTSPEAIAVARTAAALRKHVHVGRVNTAHRIFALLDAYAVRGGGCMIDTIDGSGASRFDHMLEDILAAIRGVHPQRSLDIKRPVWEDL